MEKPDRASLAKFCSRCLEDLKISPKEAAKRTGCNRASITKLPMSTPQLRILDPLAKLIQKEYRNRWRSRQLMESDKRG